jgi:hypothetical protein
MFERVDARTYDEMESALSFGPTLRMYCVSRPHWVVESDGTPDPFF